MVFTGNKLEITYIEKRDVKDGRTCRIFWKVVVVYKGGYQCKAIKGLKELLVCLAFFYIYFFCHGRKSS